jgi:hypothetical protein
MKNYIIICLLLISAALRAQKADSNSVNRIHLELSARLGGGITSKPFFTVMEKLNYKADPRERKFYDDSERGNFQLAALQLSLVGKNHVYAFVIEPGISISSQHLKYSTKSSGQAYYGNTVYNYTLNVQKIDLTFTNRFFLNKKHALFIDFGVYTAYESAKFMTGTIPYEWSSNVSASWGGSSYDSGTTEYKKHPLKNKGQNGLLTGIGYNIYLKNKSIIGIDLRLIGHQLFGQESDELKVKDLGLSIGYTFLNTKSTR